MEQSLSLRLIERRTLRFIWTTSSTSASTGFRFEPAVRDLAFVRFEFFFGGTVMVP